MSGFFERMAERGAGLEQPLRLRPAQPFEAGFAEPAIAQPAAPDVPPPDEGRTAEDRPAAAGADERPTAAPPPMVSPAERPAAAHVPPPGRGADESAPLERATAADTGALAPAPGDEPGRRPAQGDEPGRRRPPSGDERGRRATKPEPAVAAQPAPPRAPAEPPPARPEIDRPPARPVRRPRRPSRAPEVDVITLLREHVVPVLVERRAVERRERPVVADRPAVPRLGTVSVAPVDVVTEDEAPQVNVSIGRVVVTRAPAAPPPAPAPRSTTVDHEAYLARRRARP